jgi:hypothetical protein
MKRDCLLFSTVNSKFPGGNLTFLMLGHSPGKERAAVSESETLVRRKST